MPPFKAKILGILAITFVSFIQVSIILLGLAYLNPFIFSSIRFLIDLAFPIVVVLSFRQGQNVGNLILIPQLLQFNKKKFINSTTAVLSRVTIYGTIISIFIFLIICYFNGIDLDYWLDKQNTAPSIVYLITIALLGLHEDFSKKIGSPLTYFILKKFR